MNSLHYQLFKNFFTLLNVGDLANCYNIGRQTLIHGHYPLHQEVERNIDGVTVDKIFDVAGNYIYDRAPVVSAVGQHENLVDFNALNLRFTWLRS